MDILAARRCNARPQEGERARGLLLGETPDDLDSEAAHLGLVLL